MKDLVLLVALCGACWALWRWLAAANGDAAAAAPPGGATTRHRAPVASPKAMRALLDAALPADLAPEHHAAAVEALDAFGTAFSDAVAECRAATPVEAAATDAVRRMFALRGDVLRHAHAMRMRLPNDLDAERRAVAAIEAVDDSLAAYIDDARWRLGRPLLHPGPLHDWHARWHRAADDVVL